MAPRESKHTKNCRCSRCQRLSHFDVLELRAKNKRPANVTEAIILYGHDEDFVPPIPGEATDAPPGSEAKVALFRQRIERGERLFHPQDKMTYDGCQPGIVKPREGTSGTHIASVIRSPNRIIRKAL